jgi:tripartite ATP-independent transporter DctP family solute receptor
MKSFQQTSARAATTLSKQEAVKPGEDSVAIRQITNKRTAADVLARPISRRSALKGGAAFGAGFAVSSFGIIGRASAETVTMRFGSDSPIGAPHTKSAVTLKEMVEQKTDGRVKVTIYPDSQLGNNGVMTNAVKSGTLDAVVTDVSWISTAVPEADVFNLPFLYHDTQHVLRFANGPVGEGLKPKMEQAFSCAVLGFATDGSRNMWNGVRPIRKPEDITGLKFGVQSSKIQRDTILAFGGIPTVVSIKDLYTALQTGLVDGSDKTLADIIQVKLYQVSKYLTLTNHYSIVSVMIASKKFMDKLSPADQAVVREAGQAGVQAQIDAVLAGDKSSLDFIKEKGMQVFQMEDPKAFSSKLDAVYKEAADRIGAEIVDKARQSS